MGIGGVIGRQLGMALARMGKGAASAKKAAPIPKPHMWDVKATAQYRAAKAIADPRLPHYEIPWDKHAAIAELPHEKGVCTEYLETLLKSAKKKDEVQTIIHYIKSTAAQNLSPDARAHLMIACMEKLKYIDVVAQFFH